jgi:hypothetical protein
MILVPVFRKPLTKDVLFRESAIAGQSLAQALPIHYYIIGAWPNEQVGR